MKRNAKHAGKLEGKIALINSGIGLATVREFVNEGAYVFSVPMLSRLPEAVIRDQPK